MVAGWVLNKLRTCGCRRLAEAMCRNVSPHIMVFVLFAFPAGFAFAGQGTVLDDKANDQLESEISIPDATVSMPPPIPPVPNNDLLPTFPRSPKKPERLNVNGSSFMSFNSSSVSAGSGSGLAAFQQDNYGMARDFNHYSSVFVKGPLHIGDIRPFGDLRVQGQFNTSRFGPDANWWRLEYPLGDTTATFGALNTDLGGNQFVSLFRRVEGLQVRHRFGNKGEIKLIASRSRARVVTDTFAGDGTAGPYFLQNSPVVDGSEQVRLDERIMERGVDYVLNYGFGQLTFLGATIIPVTSMVAVTYETLRPGEGLGNFLGLRGEWRVKRGLRTGLTILARKAPSAGIGTMNHRREEFFGGNTTGPFQLQARPVEIGSDQVFVNGILLERDTDYTVNYISGLLLFRQPVPSGYMIVVEYDQQVSSGSEFGNHHLLGLDMQAAFGSNAGLKVQVAGSSQPAQEGVAFDVRGGMRSGAVGSFQGEQPRWQIDLGLRGITPGFKRVENADFSRNESGVDLHFRAAPLDDFELTTHFTRQKTKEGRFFGLGSSVDGGGSTNRDFNVALKWRRPNFPELSLAYSALSSDFLSGGQDSTNEMNDASLTLFYRRGQINLSGALDLVSQQLRNASINANTRTKRGRFSVGYSPGNNLNILLDWSSNSVSGDQMFSGTNNHLVTTVDWMALSRRSLGGGAAGFKEPVLQVNVTHQQTAGGASVGSTVSGYGGGALSGFGGGWGFGGYGVFGAGSGTDTAPPSAIPSSVPSGGWGGGVFGGYTAPSGHFRSSGRQVDGSSVDSASASGSRSSSTIASLTINPIRSRNHPLILDVSFQHDETRGSSLITDKNNVGLSWALSYQVFRNMNLFGQFIQQKSQFFQPRSETFTEIGTLGIQYGDYEHFNASVSIQRMHNESAGASFSSFGFGAGNLSDDQIVATTFDSFHVRAGVPIAARFSLVGRFAALRSVGPLSSYKSRELELGLEYRLLRNIGLEATVTSIRRRDSAEGRTNFDANVFSAKINAHF